MNFYSTYQIKSNQYTTICVKIVSNEQELGSRYNVLVTETDTVCL